MSSEPESPERWTKMSALPSSGTMQPYERSSLKSFTLPLRTALIAAFACLKLKAAASCEEGTAVIAQLSSAYDGHAAVGRGAPAARTRVTSPKASGGKTLGLGRPFRESS